MPTEMPGDLYQEVADTMNRGLGGGARHNSLSWDGQATRDLVKKPVMTTPYGVSPMGMRRQLANTLIEQETEAGQTAVDWRAAYAVADTLALHTQAALRETAAPAVRIMDWLRGVAEQAAKANRTLEWTSPSGLHVVQDYPVMKARSLSILLENRTVRPRVLERTGRQNTRKHKSAVTANFIHTLDSAHLVATVNALSDKGITDINLMHDDYATHASDMDTLSAVVRETFIDQYQRDILGEFRGEVARRLSLDIPEPPPVGTLDLGSLREAVYFIS